MRRQLFEEGFSSGKFKRQWGNDRTKGLLSVGAIRILKFFGIVFIEFTTVNNFCLHMIILETNVVMEEDF